MKEDEFVNEFAAIVELPPDQLTAETVMSEIGAWDSVAYLSAMVMIDERLGVTINPDTLSKSETFGDILTAVRGSFSS